MYVDDMNYQSAKEWEADLLLELEGLDSGVQTYGPMSNREEIQKDLEDVRGRLAQISADNKAHQERLRLYGD